MRAPPALGHGYVACTSCLLSLQACRWLESAQNPTNRVVCWQDGRAECVRGAGCNLLNTLLTGLFVGRTAEAHACGTRAWPHTTRPHMCYP